MALLNKVSLLKVPFTHQLSFPYPFSIKFGHRAGIPLGYLASVYTTVNYYLEGGGPQTRTPPPTPLRTKDVLTMEINSLPTLGMRNATAYFHCANLYTCAPHSLQHCLHLSCDSFLMLSAFE